MEDFDCDDVAALDPLDENAVVKFIGGRYRAAPEGRPAKHHLIYTRAGLHVARVDRLRPRAAHPAVPPVPHLDHAVLAK